jgi:hypothetical protein
MNAKARGGGAAMALAASLAACLAASLAAGPALADRISHPTAVFEGLDKITGRIITFEVGIGESVQFGTLLVTPRVCYTRPPTEAPRTDGFVEVDEIAQQKIASRIFTGWMFAASPGLHGVEHPVYDIWLTDCKGGTKIETTPPEQAEAPDIGLPDLAAPPATADAKLPPAAAPRKRRAARPVEAAPNPVDLGAAITGPPTSRGGVRRYVPLDAPPPIPPGNVGQ